MTDFSEELKKRLKRIRDLDYSVRDAHVEMAMLVYEVVTKFHLTISDVVEHCGVSRPFVEKLAHLGKYLAQGWLTKEELFDLGVSKALFIVPRWQEQPGLKEIYPVKEVKNLPVHSLKKKFRHAEGKQLRSDFSVRLDYETKEALYKELISLGAEKTSTGLYGKDAAFKKLLQKWGVI